jgi:hypothetical protein
MESMNLPGEEFHENLVSYLCTIGGENGIHELAWRSCIWEKLMMGEVDDGRSCMWAKIE